MMNIWEKEPVLVIAFVTAAIGLAVAFGLSVSKEQGGAIVAFVTALLAVVARSKVTPIK